MVIPMEINMKRTGFIVLLLFLVLGGAAVYLEENAVKNNKLTPDEENVIVRKGTERPFSGLYVNHKEKGTYVCKRCESQLYRSDSKFDSRCGWPVFDDEIPGAVKRIPDADGERVDITCAKCGAHLGHVSTGEGFTAKNTRHCVNSISLNFIPDVKEAATETAYFAGGCFWGVEYYLKKEAGVLSTRVGYMGGHTKNPTYEEVCSGSTGHAETLEVVFDPSRTSFEKLARLFFETHDPTQKNRQGPDIGEQYRSAIFYTGDDQRKNAEKLIGILRDKGFGVATELTQAGTFWAAENYHQDYYGKTGKRPYCHGYTKRF